VCPLRATLLRPRGASATPPRAAAAQRVCAHAGDGERWQTHASRWGAGLAGVLLCNQARPDTIPAEAARPCATPCLVSNARCIDGVSTCTG
jgi:hypothetical protein